MKVGKCDFRAQPTWFSEPVKKKFFFSFFFFYWGLGEGHGLFSKDAQCWVVASYSRSWLDMLKVKEIILKSPKKSWMLHPISTYQVHECWNLITRLCLVLSPFLSSNHWSSCASFAKKQNKKQTTEKISLHVFSKILETTVSRATWKLQTAEHLLFQSAYREDHSTETLLLRVKWNRF